MPRAALPHDRGDGAEPDPLRGAGREHRNHEGERPRAANIAVSPHRVRPTFRKPFYQKPKTDPASLKKACKASIKEAWRPKAQKVGYTYHKNACS